MPERNLVTAQILRSVIEVSPSHSCAEIAGRLFYRVNTLEYVRFENGYGDIQKLCVFLYLLSVLTAVTGVHHQKFKPEREFVVPFQLLKEFCKREAVFSSRHTHGDFIVFPNQFVFVYRLGEPRKHRFFEFFPQARFDVLRRYLFFFHNLRILFYAFMPISSSITKI